MQVTNQIQRESITFHLRIRTFLWFLLAFIYIAASAFEVQSAILLAPQKYPTTTQLYSTATYEETVWKRVNYHRQLAGLPTYSLKQLSGETPALAKTAQNHADYLALNNKVISHTEQEGLDGFTGVSVGDRAKAAGYAYQGISEVISAGQGAQVGVDSLIRAIYHRYSLLDPDYTEMGVGNNGNHPAYGNVLVINPALPKDASPATQTIAMYPAANQTDVPVVFSSNTEIPDPVADKDLVGYPVSIHFSGDYEVLFQSFSISQDGTVLDSKLLSHATETNIPRKMSLP